MKKTVFFSIISIMVILLSSCIFNNKPNTEITISSVTNASAVDETLKRNPNDPAANGAKAIITLYGSSETDSAVKAIGLSDTVTKNVESISISSKTEENYLDKLNKIKVKFENTITKESVYIALKEISNNLSKAVSFDVKIKLSTEEFQKLLEKLGVDQAVIGKLKANMPEEGYIIDKRDLNILKNYIDCMIYSYESKSQKLQQKIDEAISLFKNPLSKKEDFVKYFNLSFYENYKLAKWDEIAKITAPVQYLQLNDIIQKGVFVSPKCDGLLNALDGIFITMKNIYDSEKSETKYSDITDIILISKDFKTTKTLPNKFKSSVKISSSLFNLSADINAEIKFGFSYKTLINGKEIKTLYELVSEVEKALPDKDLKIAFSGTIKDDTNNETTASIEYLFNNGILYNSGFDIYNLNLGINPEKILTLITKISTKDTSDFYDIVKGLSPNITVTNNDISMNIGIEPGAKVTVNLKNLKSPELISKIITNVLGNLPK